MRTFGRYRLLEFLASGGMADVWRAEADLAEGVVKEVALKLVRGEHAAKGDFVRMFVQEARLAARLTHANVVQVFEFDQVDGRYFIAMELVRGQHLGRVVERARDLGLRFGLARAVQVAAEVARGLAYAHRLADGGRPAGVVHRDVSPSNVLLSYEGEVKLADFGIARALGQAGLTDPGTVKGKAAYMAPEQARGLPVDARADVFALGVVAWELAAGRRLFARETEAATLAALLSDEPVSPPSAWNEEVPPELDRALLAALERDPARRTASAQALAAALAEVLLKVAKAHEDVDLRAFMRRLFSAEAAAAEAPPPEPTRVRPPPAPIAAEPTAGGGGEAETRTILRRGQDVGRGRGALAAVAAVAGMTLIGGAVLVRQGLPPTAAANSTANPTAAPAPPSTPTSPPTAAPAPTPRSTATSVPTSTPTATATAAATEPPDSDQEPWPTSDNVNETPPPAGSGDGILAVTSLAYGNVLVDRRPAGYTPVAVRLPAGSHEMLFQRPGQKPLRRRVEIRAGARTSLRL